MDRLDLLAVQGTLKSLLQHHSSKASILQCSAFLTVQISHAYVTTGKGKVMSLLFNMLSRLVITFLPRNKCLLISWLQSPSAVISGGNKCLEKKEHGIWSHQFIANRWGNNGNSDRLYFLGSEITADGDCSHEIKRRLLLGRKVMTNLDSIFKSRDITLPTKVHLIKAMVFPVVMYGCESWTVKKAEH